MKLRVLYHGSCFDGCSSAGLFTRFYRECVARGDIDVGYTHMEHKGPGPAITPAQLDGDDNVCVDFRYSQEAKLGWWFDHHVSAFQEPDDEKHFRADTSGHKFYDPQAKSCAKFLATTVADKFGFDTKPVAELIEWAQIIDGALFPHARMPVELKEPALQLMTWVENNRDNKLSERFIADLVSRPLGEIAGSDYIKVPFAKLLEQHQRNLELVGKTARADGAVVVTDLADQQLAGINKFIVYYLHPETRYSVTVLNTGARMKISVGSNPWSPVPRTHDIAAICEKYGGGGHPVVGAIPAPKGDVARARQIAAEVIATLQT